MVARASLTDSLMGESYAPENGKMTVEFSRSLDGITKANMEYLEAIEADGAGSVQTYAAKMDPRQLSVVALVRDRSNKVLQAVHADAVNPDEDS